MKQTTPTPHGDGALFRPHLESPWAFLLLAPVVRECNEEGDFHKIRPCEVISRDDNQQLYTVQLFNHWSTDPNEVIFLYDYEVIVTNFPRRAMTFADDLYTTDQVLPNTFRRTMMVPDKLFTRTWMDHLYDAEDEFDETMLI
jgi:hypothetical protein